MNEKVKYKRSKRCAGKPCGTCDSDRTIRLSDWAYNSLGAMAIGLGHMASTSAVLIFHARGDPPVPTDLIVLVVIGFILWFLGFLALRKGHKKGWLYEPRQVEEQGGSE